MINDVSWKHRNESYPAEFILLGMANHPHLELLLSAVVLIGYVMTLLGNTTIVVVSCLDPHLQTPMYFFLSNLSFLDLCYTTSLGPQMLVNFWTKRKTISYVACAVQLYVSLGLGSTECVLLAAMAYDRYAAYPGPAPKLHHTIMSHSVMFQNGWFLLGGWLPANSLVQSAMTLSLPLCGHNKIDHFFCEVPTLLRLSCVDTSVNEAELLGASVVILLIPLSLIIISYFYITRNILRIRSVEGRRKAFNTCASHVTVVSLFYGSAIFSYVQPPSNYSRDQGKMMSLFYTMVAPMLNPLIYTLRNKEFHRAVKRVMGREPRS
ncbi:putative olfactory receptor 2B8 [Sphaerodactylus townsendi]|uniref:putative olfactory receptor 2B8 n=1 Tax=Sphaerodactylus townsendi TaxID=933632 RepID=UPI0020275F80|nr:putative olfactory receptor 2B8 [Sphaerodactylus townsendi]